MHRLSHLHLGDKFFNIKYLSRPDSAQKNKHRYEEELPLGDDAPEVGSICFTQLDSKPFEEESE